MFLNFIRIYLGVDAFFSSFYSVLDGQLHEKLQLWKRLFNYFSYCFFPWTFLFSVLKKSLLNYVTFLYISCEALNSCIYSYVGLFLLLDLGDYLALLAGCLVSTVTESPGPDKQLGISIKCLFCQSCFNYQYLLPFCECCFLLLFLHLPPLLIVAEFNFLCAITSLISQDQIELLLLLFLFSLRWAVLLGHHCHYLLLWYFPSVSGGPWFRSFLWMKAWLDGHWQWFWVSFIVCTSVSWAGLFLEWLTTGPI